MDFGIQFCKSPHSNLQRYTDVDYLGCIGTRCSRGAYLLQLVAGPVSWSSKLQLTVSDSTTEAKYKALSECAKEAVYIRRLLLELNLLSAPQVPIFHSNSNIHTNLAHASIPSAFDIHLHCDNQGSIKLAQNPISHAHTKHIEGKHHFIRERVLEWSVRLLYINTEENPADLLTKPLTISI